VRIIKANILSNLPEKIVNAINNQKAVDLFNKLANAYQERFFSVEAYKEPLFNFLVYLRNRASVLDVACGPGNISHFLLKEKPELKLLGIDLAPNMIDLAVSNNPGAKFIVHNAMEIDRLDDSFDAIVVGFLFPYLPKEQVELFIQKAWKKLNKNGIIYISTMEDRYENSRMRTSSTGDQVMMYYYETFFLTDLLERTGFHILSTYTQPFAVSETETDTDLILIASKHH